MTLPSTASFSNQSPCWLPVYTVAWGPGTKTSGPEKTGMEVPYVILGYTLYVDPMWWFPKIGVPPLLDGLVLGKSNFELCLIFSTSSPWFSMHSAIRRQSNWHKPARLKIALAKLSRSSIPLHDCDQESRKPSGTSCNLGSTPTRPDLQNQVAR